MHPDPPKTEEDFAEHMGLLQDNMRRLEACGDEYELAPVYKIESLRMIMTGKAKEYFDIWEEHPDNTDAAESYEELLSKIKDYARRRKLDSTAEEKMQHGGDPLDAGDVCGWV